MATKRRKKATPQAASDVSRRRFLQRVIAASAATGAAVALPHGAAASEPAAAAAGGLAEAAAAAGAGTPFAEAGSAFTVFTEDQARLFASVLDRLIPAEGAMPGAGEIGLAGYVDRVLADGPHLRQPILDILSEVTVACHGDTASPQEIDSLLARLEGTHREAFASLIETVYTGYYSHPQVLDAIGWVHPGSEADASETLDAALLEDVVRRGPIYRHV